MDDVITVTAKDDSTWDVDRFREDFRRSECYWAPLKLEAAESTHFLETTLERSTQAEVSGRDSRTLMRAARRHRECGATIVGIASHALK